MCINFPVSYFNRLNTAKVALHFFCQNIVLLFHTRNNSKCNVLVINAKLIFSLGLCVGGLALGAKH